MRECTSASSCSFRRFIKIFGYPKQLREAHQPQWMQIFSFTQKKMVSPLTTVLTTSPLLENFICRKKDCVRISFWFHGEDVIFRVKLCLRSHHEDIWGSWSRGLIVCGLIFASYYLEGNFPCLYPYLCQAAGAWSALGMAPRLNTGAPIFVNFLGDGWSTDQHLTWMFF